MSNSTKVVCNGAWCICAGCAHSVPHKLKPGCCSPGECSRRLREAGSEQTTVFCVQTQETSKEASKDEPKFSQCPWVVGSYVWPDGYEDPDGPFVQIGETRWSPNKVDDPGSPQQKYDARLMAAAPDLYAALEHLVAWASLEETPRLSDLLGTARAALAKAKG